MENSNQDQETRIKILYWGMAGSGKTTSVDTLYSITKNQKKERGQLIAIEPKEELKKIGKKDGSTLYFDRGFFQSKNQEKVNYHIFTVAGQSSYSPLRARIYEGTDGVIFVVDSQTRLLEDNVESLKELKNVARGKLIKEIPMVIMLNKQDLQQTITTEIFIQVLKNEKLWFKQDDPFSLWNPIIYETCAIYDKRQDIYQSFSECARRTRIYKIYGNGKAPIDETISEVRI